MMGSLLWLALGAFAVGTEGFMIAGLLPTIGGDLGVSVAAAGDLVMVFGVTYAVGSPIVAVLTGSLERKRLLLAAIAAFGIANLLAAWLPGFTALLAARALLALTAATFMPAATAYAATTVAPERRGRAISLVYTGFTLALVVGVPLGTLIGNAFGWRATFEGIAVLAVLGWIGLALALRPLEGAAAIGLRARLAAASVPGVPSTLLLTVLALAGAFSVYTYFAPYVQTALGLGSNGVALFLLLFGAAAFVGNLAGGYVADRVPARRALRVTLSVLTLAFVSMALVPQLPQPIRIPVAVVAVALWGMFGWGTMPIQQVRLARAAPKLVAVTMSLNSSAIYLGAALGATLGGVAVAQANAGTVGWIAAMCDLAGLAVVLLSFRRSAPAAETDGGSIPALELAGE